MQKVFSILSITLICLTGCSEKPTEVKMIPLTTSSAEAEALLNQVLKNREHGMEYLNTGLITRIDELDPGFVWARFNRLPQSFKNYQFAYERRDTLSSIERRVLELYSDMFTNGIVSANRIIDQLIEDHPDYFQLRLISANLRKGLGDVEGIQSRLKEAVELHPESFFSYLELAKLHFETDRQLKVSEVKLPEEKRDLKVAEQLLEKAQNIVPASPLPKRWLGNLYLARGDVEGAAKIFKKSLILIEEKDSELYANIVRMLGTVHTFTGDYESARESYKSAIDILIGLPSEKTSNALLLHECLYQNALTYIFERKYDRAVITISEAQNTLNNFRSEGLSYMMSDLEKLKLKAVSHSLDRESSKVSLEKLEQYIKQAFSGSTETFLSKDADTKKTNKSDIDSKMTSAEYWTFREIYNNRASSAIVFSDFGSARDILENYRLLATSFLEKNPTAMVDYHKLNGQLRLMEGDAQGAIQSYEKLTPSEISADAYHKYFYALAKKSVGDLSESRTMLESIENFYVPSWETAFVRNLAVEQLASW